MSGLGFAIKMSGCSIKKKNKLFHIGIAPALGHHAICNNLAIFIYQYAIMIRNSIYHYLICKVRDRQTDN